MDQRIKSLLMNLTHTPPAEEHVLAEVERHFNCQLPQQYRTLMAETDGGAAEVGEQEVIFWQAGEIIQANTSLEVQQCAPGLLLFGGNGGGEAFAFDTRKTHLPIVMVPMIGLSHQDAIPVGDTLEEFLINAAEDNLF